MYRLVLMLIFCGSLVPLSAFGQRPAEKPNPMTSLSPGELKATPEMWFYEQYLRQYQDPKMAVRAKAEFDCLQRQRRIAARKWFGLSLARPRWSADIYNWDQSPGWTSNNGAYPYRWQGNVQPWYLALPPRYDVRLY
jgi:hypothetical protein